MWTIPDAADLEGIVFQPPPYWSGELTLNLTAVAYELINGDQAFESLSFDIEIVPVASPFDILATDITLPPSGAQNLDLNIIFFDQRGYDTGENPPEIIEFTLTGIPEETFLYASKGGRLVKNDTDVSWVFTGTEEQVNALQIANVNAKADATYLIEYSGVTQDGDSMLDPPFTDDFGFRLFVKEDATEDGVVEIARGDNYTAESDGNNMIYAAENGSQNIVGGAGMDWIFVNSTGINTLTGGAGADQFIWESSAVLGGSPDVITDFNAADGDQLSLSGLLSDFNIQTDAVSDFVRIVGSTIQIYDGSSWIAVVELQPTTAATAQELWESGNLLL